MRTLPDVRDDMSVLADVKSAPFRPAGPGPSGKQAKHTTTINVGGMS